jgi:hypothetical protein
VVPSATLGYVTVWPTGQAQPLVSTLNSLDGRIKSNAAIVPAGTGGAVSVYATDATNVILDINGYFVPTTVSTALAFYPVTPCRVADTRNASGALGGPSLVGGQVRSFPVQSACSIPSSAQAYSLNFTAIPQGPLGYLSLWPAGQSQPLVSTLNAPTGTVTANAAIVPAGTNGAIDLYTTNNADMVIDVNGYFAPAGSGGLSLYTLTPCRVPDTRQGGVQPFSGALNVNVTGASNCGVPLTAQAYVFNATVVPPSSLGYLTLWPEGASQPLVSTLNALDGSITSNMAIVPTSNGSISAFASNPTHLILDISGYFGPLITVTGQTVIHTAADLQGMSSNMAANYVLDADIDFSGIANFIPIGASADANPIPFTGTFDGAGHTITGLTQISAGQNAGLFGLIGTGGSITNILLQNALITSNYSGGSLAAGNPIPGMIGILAGENNQGSITNVTVIGTIVSTSSGSACGGLVGVNLGSISKSSASVTLTATLNDSDSGLPGQSTQIGGIAGRNNATITNVIAAGMISVKLNANASSGAVFGAQIGGLVGLSDNGGNVAGSHSSVNISATFSGSSSGQSTNGTATKFWNAIGGLIGNADTTGSIANSSSSGTVTVTSTINDLDGGWCVETVGGLLGSGGSIDVLGTANPNGTPTIAGSSAGGIVNVTGQNDSITVGGLVGQFNGTIASSYSSGSVGATGGNYNGVGGLVGQIFSGAITDVKASGSVTSVDTALGADVGGLAGTSGAVISTAIASGAVSSKLTITLPLYGITTEDCTVGGLVGYNHGVIKNAIALGPVTANFAGSVSGSGSTYNDQVAGLVANSIGSISNSSAGEQFR